MHQLFTIDHLVHEICSYVPRSELPVLARVSSTWFRCAISFLYKNLELKEALAPLGEVVFQSNIKQFANVDPPSDEAFNRLSKYTPYVRDLQINPFFTSIVVEAMRRSVSRGFPYLFPNTRSLTWQCLEYSLECTELLIGLISPKIDQLSLYISDHRILHYLCPLVMARTPALHSVTIRDTTKMTGAAEPPFAKLVEDILTFFMHSLTSVQLSFSLNTPSIFECLSKMPNLSELRFIGGRKGEQKRHIIHGKQGDFISLRSFWFDNSSQPFYDMFENSYGLFSLTIFNAKVVPSDLGTFLATIAGLCPNITSLSLGDRRSHDPWAVTWPVSPWQPVKSLSRCKYLTCLSLNWMRFIVTLEELTEFLKDRTWTRLHVLTSVPLRLQDILLYAKHCPNLEHLGIYVNDSAFSLEDLPTSSDLPTFPVLTSIEFSCGIINKPNPHTLALFLYRICKKPLYQLRGLGDDMVDNVLARLATFYVDDEYRTGTPMSTEAKELVKTMVRKKIITP